MGSRDGTSRSDRSNAPPPQIQRSSTMPFEKTTRRKPRRWPLVLRFIKGAIHHSIGIQVFLHTAFAALVVFCDQHLHLDLGLPQSISLGSCWYFASHHVPLQANFTWVFRNQTSYNRFWEGRGHLGVIITSVRNLTRHFLACSYVASHTAFSPPTPARLAEHADTERTVRLLIAILYATKNHLRGDWGGYHGISSRAPSRAPSQAPSRPRSPTASLKSKARITLPDSKAFLRNRQRHETAIRTDGKRRPHERNRQLRDRAHVSEFADLVPPGLVGYETRGLGIPLQFATLVEGYIKRGHDRGWWPAPQASQLSTQLNTLVDAYGKMETIRLTPVPVALLIHQKQVLGLFGAVLPFAMVKEQGWWAVPITALVVFTLYGIEAIATQLEDPFGYDRADIDMDALMEDIRCEAMVLLQEWKRVIEDEGELVDGEVGKGGGDSSAQGEGSMEASGFLGSSTLVGSAESEDGKSGIKRRGEEGGDWFINHQSGDRVLSWGTVRFEDDV